MNTNINATNSTISPIEAIDGIEILASLDELTGEWVCNDGFNTTRVETKEEAVNWVEEAIDFYSEA